MTNTPDTAAQPAHLDDPRVRHAFDTLRTCVALYGATCAVTLATVAVVAAAGAPVNTFMWVRAVILLAIAPVLHRMAVRAAHGARRSFERLRTLSAILPIAVVAVDLIPGVCPPWYAGMQAVSAAALAGAAVLTRGSVLRA